MNLQSPDGALPAGRDDVVLEARICLALTELLPALSVAGSIEALLGFAADDYLSARISLKQQIHPDDTDVAGMLFRLAIPAPPAASIFGSGMPMAAFAASVGNTARSPDQRAWCSICCCRTP